MPAGLTLENWAALVALGFVALVLAVVAVWLLAGLFTARSLVRRELTAYFTSPIAYVVLVVFLFVTGYRFSVALEQLTAVGPEGAEYPMQVMYSILPSSLEKLGFTEFLSSMSFALVYLLIPPLLTMRLFAEERASGTLELLMTAPVRDWQVVLSKYAACLGFYVLMWVPTLVYLPILLNMGEPFFVSVWTPFSIAMVAGIGALVVSLLLAILPEKQAAGWVSILLLGVASLATLGWLLWPFLEQRAPGPFRVIPFATFGVGLVLWLALPSGNAGRLTTLILFLAGVVAVAVGGYGHYTHDATDKLIDIPIAIDPMPVLTTYLGLLLVGAMLLAVGMLVSSLVRSQLVAAMLALVLSLALLVVGIVWRPDPGSTSLASDALASLSVPVHLHRDFCRGLIDTRHVTLYLSVAVFSLFLTVRSLESRRWR